MTPERLAEIKERAARATPGEWIDSGGYVSHADGGFIIGDGCDEDTAFIAAARQDVPELIAALEAAWARVAELEAQLPRSGGL